MLQICREAKCCVAVHSRLPYGHTHETTKGAKCQKVPWPSSSLSKFASFGFCSIIFNGFSILLSSLVFSLSPSDSLPGSLSAVFSSFRCEFSFFYVKLFLNQKDLMVN